MMSERPEKPESCECCDYDTPSLEYYSPRPGQDTGRWLCEICASTDLETIVIHPQIYSADIAAIARSMGWIANRILDEIRKPDTK